MNDLLKHIGLRIHESVEEKNWKGVEHWSKELLKYAPQKTLGFKWLARASMALGKIDRAAYAYNRVLDYEPSSDEAKQFFADHARKELMPDPQPKAIAYQDDSQQVLSVEQKSFLGRAEFESGTAYETVSMFAEAAEHFQKSFYWFSHPQAAYKAAEMFHRAQKSFEAMKLLRETLNANPSWVEGYLMAARIHFDLGQLTSAQNAWQQVLKLEPRNEEALRRLRSTWDVSVTRDALGGF